VAKREKLLDGIRNNPKGVRFGDACKAAEIIGFVKMGGKGSHTVYARTGEPTILNFQNRSGYVPPYQARQLIEMLDKYEG
jgi:hypothetical protein